MAGDLTGAIELYGPLDIPNGVSAASKPDARSSPFTPVAPAPWRQSHQPSFAPDDGGLTALVVSGNVQVLHHKNLISFIYLSSHSFVNLTTNPHE